MNPLSNGTGFGSQDSDPATGAFARPALWVDRGPACEERGFAAACRVYMLAARLLGNEQLAEEVTQDVLPGLLAQSDAVLGSGPNSYELYRATVTGVNAARDRQTPAVRSAHPTPPGAGVAGAFPEALGAAVTALPEDLRDPFVLSDVEGLRPREVCDLLNLTPAVMKARLHQARLRVVAALRVGAGERACATTLRRSTGPGGRPSAK